MDGIPEGLIAGLSPADADSARLWWAVLSKADRAEVRALSTPEGRPIGSPKIRGGRSLADDEGAGWSAWLVARFEDLVALPDPAFYEPPYVRLFHIG